MLVVVCVKTVLKVVFLNDFFYFVQIWISVFHAIKVFICEHEFLSPQIIKGLGPQVANPQIFTFVEGPQILQILLLRKFADLLFAEVICGPHLC